MVAAGSIKAFRDGDIEQYAQWSHNLDGKTWTARMKQYKRGDLLTNSEEQKSDGQCALDL